jgi:hypothetical protein
MSFLFLRCPSVFLIYFSSILPPYVLIAPNDWSPNHKIKNWLQKLNSMRAVDEIDEEDSRQLYLDLDSAYSEFTRYLKRNKSG